MGKGKPIFTIHWFNWYVVTPNSPLEEQEKRWTYKPMWEKLGIPVDEIGISRRYYQKQFEMIKDAGFDGLMWEWHSQGLPRVTFFKELKIWKWHGSNPPDVAIDAAKDVGLKLGIFYDMEIRYQHRPGFITPTLRFADNVVDDVVFFYKGIPRDLWLYDRENRLAMIFYGYQFDEGISDTTQWRRFYSYIIEGIKKELSTDIVIHWTYAHKPQQLYGYQNFKEIKSYTFNMLHAQSCVDADSVTFVLNYDDYGVWEGNKRVRNATVGHARKENLIINDVRLLEEGLWLAEKTNPSMVFFYGWNELFEGEAIIPDETYGFGRYNLAKAMVHYLRENAKDDLEKTLIITDDILELSAVLPEVAQEEMSILRLLRSICPACETVVTGRWNREILKDYSLIIALNVRKSAEEDLCLKSLKDKRIVYVSPEAIFQSSSEKPYTKKGENFFVLHIYRADKDIFKSLFEDVLQRKLRDGLLFAWNAKTVRLTGITISYETNPSIIERQELPIDKIVYVAPEALKEDVMVLPKAKSIVGFKFLRGKDRKIEVKDDRFVLRYPEVVEVTKA